MSVDVELDVADVREDLVDLGRLFAALVVVEVVASLAFAVGLVAWATGVSTASPTLYDLVGGTAWVAGMTLPDVLLVELAGDGLDQLAIAAGCYAVAVLVVGLGVRALEARGESR